MHSSQDRTDSCSSRLAYNTNGAVLQAQARGATRDYFLCFFLQSARYSLIASFIDLEIGMPGLSFIERNPASNGLSIQTAIFSLSFVRVDFSGTGRSISGYVHVCQRRDTSRKAATSQWRFWRGLPAVPLFRLVPNYHTSPLQQ